MALLTRLVLLDCGALLIGFFGIVAFKLANGTISLAGLLFAKGAGRRSFSPARLQLLIFTVVVAADYLHALIVNPQQTSLPPIPQNVITALGGSQAVYLAGKAISTYIQPLHRNSG
jgi:hypothetical protein